MNWRPPVRDAMIFVVTRLSPARLAPKLLEQIELPPDTPAEVATAAPDRESAGAAETGAGHRTQPAPASGAAQTRWPNWKTEFAM